mgnify:CR=1 FL=1
MTNMELLPGPKKLKQRIDNLIGVQARNIVDPKDLVGYARILGMEEAGNFFNKLVDKRYEVRFSQYFGNLFTLGMLYFLTQPIQTPETQILTGLCFAGACVSEALANKRATENGAMVGNHILSMSDEIKTEKLGQVGNEAAISMRGLASLSSGERTLNTRSIDVLSNLALKSIIIGIKSENSYSILMSISAILSIIQIVYAKTAYRNNEIKVVNAQNRFQSNPKKFLKELMQIIKEKGDLTVISNLINVALGLIPYFGQGSEGAVLANVKNTAGTVTSQSVQANMNMALKNNVQEKMKKVSELLSLKIRSDADLSAHKNKKQDKLPNDIVKQLKRLNEDALILNVEIQNVTTGANYVKCVKVIHSFKDPIFIIGDNGSAKSKLIDAILHKSDEHKGPIAFFVSRGKKIIDLHDLSLDEIRKLVVVWNPKEREETNKSFLELTGLSEEQTIKLFMEKELADNSNPIFDRKSDFHRFITTDLGHVDNMSNGERSLFFLVTFLLNAEKDGAKYAILDESFSMIDPYRKKFLIKLINYFHYQRGLKIICVGQEKPSETTDEDQIVNFSKPEIIRKIPLLINISEPGFAPYKIDAIFSPYRLKYKRNSLIVYERSFDHYDFGVNFINGLIQNSKEARQAFMYIFYNNGFPMGSLFLAIKNYLIKNSFETDAKKRLFLNIQSLFDQLISEMGLENDKHAIQYFELRLRKAQEITSTTSFALPYNYALSPDGPI